MTMYKLITVLVFGTLVVLQGPAAAEFSVLWRTETPSVRWPAYAAYYLSGNQGNGNVEREEAYGMLTDSPAPFMLVQREGGAVEVLDLSTGMPHWISNLTDPLPHYIYDATYFRVLYMDVDNDQRDEIVLYCAGEGIICIDWQVGPGGAIGEDGPGAGTSLMQNAPNPVSVGTTISFTLAATGDIDLQIFDVNGRLIRNLIDGKLPAGLHRIAWDGLDNSEYPLASGTYFYRLRVDGMAVDTKTAVVLK
ncbi:MAG: T9SS type A sorting domain-containing protein [Candidatus Eisenbacteria sp.]|nr:T9SS type A sorting domain-containing protein [Candidatus Eisenbacteria bacterium]